MDSKSTSTLSHLLILAAVATCVLFFNLGASRLWDRDEPRNAGCAREMLERGDWVTPMFNGKLRTAKPVLLYWLMMTAYAVFGESEFAARFWSAAMGTGTVMVTYWIGRRLFSPQVGLWSGIVLCTSLMFDVASRAATPDAPLIFLATSSLAVFVHGVFPRPELNHSTQLVATLPAAAIGLRSVVPMYGLMGLAILTKGPVGIVLPTAVAGMFLLLVRRAPGPCDAASCSDRASWRQSLANVGRTFEPWHFLRTCWAMRPVTALLVAAAVAVPWYFWVGIRTDGKWLHGFFLDENIGRALQPLENHHGPIFYYLAAIAVGFFPWSVFFGPLLLDAYPQLQKNSRHVWQYRFLACWVGVYVGVFSLAQTKLPSYVTPMYPALALLTGNLVSRLAAGQTRLAAYWPRMALGVLGAVGLAFLIGVPFVAKRYLPGEEWLAVGGLIPVIGSGLAIGWWQQARLVPAMRAVAVTAVAFTAFLFGIATVRADRHQRNHILLSAIEARSTDPQIGSWGCLEPTWVFYGRRPIQDMVVEGAAAPSLGKYLARENHFVIMTARHWKAIHQDLGDDIRVIAEVDYFLKKDSLVVVTKDPAAARTATSDLRNSRRE